MCKCKHKNIGCKNESNKELAKPHFTLEEACKVGKYLGIDFETCGYDVEQYRFGMDVELEHGRIEPHTNVTNDDPIVTGKIALAHLNEKSNEGQLLVDAENLPQFPKNFRMTTQPIDDEKISTVNLEGLSALNISGSGALSEKSLETIVHVVRQYPQFQEEDAKIMVIDARQESHLFADGTGISWYGTKNDSNIHLDPEQISQDERQKIDSIRLTKHVSLDFHPKKSRSNLREISNPSTVLTEEELTKSKGLGYLRVFTTDHCMPSNSQLERFITAVKELSENTWLHIHCRGGKGRTTILMATFDMMKNAKNVSFEDILKRQHLMGGSYFLNEEEQEKYLTRVQFLNKIYDYCKEEQDNFMTTWTCWVKEKMHAADEE